MPAPSAVVVREIRELQSVTDKPLDLCARCQGCEIRKHFEAMKRLAWDKHRHTINFLFDKCNRFKELE